MTEPENEKKHQNEGEQNEGDASQPDSVDPLATTGQAHEAEADFDPEATVNLTGDDELFRQVAAAALPHDAEVADKAKQDDVTRTHLKGLLEALIFASDKPIKPGDLAKSAAAQAKLVKELLGELKEEYHPRGIQLDEVAGGWIFRTSAAYAPFVRDLTKQKPVRLTRAQVETLAIIAYRQPMTRPEVDDIRGVDSGPVLKLLLERDLVRILGKKDEPGRPLLYGTTTVFLEFFGLRSLKDLPTLSEFTELSEDSRRVVERELGEVLDQAQPAPTVAAEGGAEGQRPGEGQSQEEGQGLEEGEASSTENHEAPGDTSGEGPTLSPDEELPHDTIAPPHGSAPATNDESEDDEAVDDEAEDDEPEDDEPEDDEPEDDEPEG